MTYYPWQFLVSLRPNFACSSRFSSASQLRAGKTQSKRSCSHFSPKRHLFPFIYPAFHLFSTITISLLVFKEEAEDYKNPLFHEFPCPHAIFFGGLLQPQFWCHRPFLIASLNRYTPKFSGVPQKLTWCQKVGLQVFQSEVMLIFVRSKRPF